MGWNRKLRKPSASSSDEDVLNDHKRSIPVRELAGARRRDVRKDNAPNVSNVWNRKNWFTKDPRTDCIPEFIPGNSNNISITRWLFKIDQLRKVHSWDDVKKGYHMQNGVRGLAKSWYSAKVVLV